MEYLNFNIHGFTAPQTKAEYMSLLREALLIADDLLEDIARFGAGVEAANAVPHD